MKKKKTVFLFSVIAVLVLLDQITKFLIVHNMAYGQSIDVISGFFNITYVKNPGAAFGIFARLEDSIRIPFFVLMPVIALIIIGYVYYKSKAKNVLQQVGLALVMSGAIGNLIDRFRYGYVVDFLDFHWKHQAHFPAFNVADSAITIGVAVLFAEMFKNAS